VKTLEKNIEEKPPGVGTVYVSLSDAFGCIERFDFVKVGRVVSSGIPVLLGVWSTNDGLSEPVHVVQPGSDVFWKEQSVIG
jgi:hypothetical protein